MKRLLIVPLMLFLLLSTSGCFNHLGQKAQLQDQFNKFKEDNIVSASSYVDGTTRALELVPLDKRTPEVELAQDLSGMAQALLPPAPIDLRIDVNALLGENKKLAVQVMAKLEQRFRIEGQRINQMEDIKVKIDKLSKILETKGDLYEKEQKKNMIRSFWVWGTGIFGVVGFGLICAFAPFLLPIIGSIFGYVIKAIVNVMPGLMKWFGVVGKGTFVRTVEGVQKFKEKIKETPPDKVFTKTEVTSLLNNELEKSQDRKDRKTVDYVKENIIEENK